MTDATTAEVPVPEVRFVVPGDPAPLGAGEVVVLRDERGRRSLVTLVSGGVWHSHSGAVDHDRLIGAPEGTTVATPKGVEIIALRATREDFILKMQRGAQVVYPKDQAMIVALADIRAGLRVVEAGAGSGALSIALLDAVGPTGTLLSVERREDHAIDARRNVERFLGGPPANWDLELGDVAEVLMRTTAHRVVLDLPEPWHALDGVAHALHPGGIVVTYLPSVPQVMEVTEALWAHGGFTDVATSETLVRGWDVDGLAVRPAHRMVAHTAFLTRARRVPTREQGGPALPRKRRRAAGVDSTSATEDGSGATEQREG
jgi:tRNA (adenine57-N1/adenine58-N1)-methyltransferase catalytic subunit